MKSIDVIIDNYKSENNKKRLPSIKRRFDFLLKELKKRG